MSDDNDNQVSQARDCQRQADTASPWVQRYSSKHRWQRLTDFPMGLLPSVKVRIYHRTNHFILQWWDPGAKRNLAERINGDLLAAAEEAGFDVLVTADKNIRHQQNLSDRQIALIELTTSVWPVIRDHLPEVLAAIEAATPGGYATVSFPRAPLRRRPFPQP